ncbi:hypothetical protein HZB89_02345 [archaeon]|nr:hypothetical protein [archaeon]
MQQEKSLAFLALAAFLLLALSFLFKPLQSMLHGLVEAFIGGNSLAETYFMLAGLIILPVAFLTLKKLKLTEKLAKHEMNLLALFLLALLAGGLLGFNLQINFRFFKTYNLLLLRIG